MKMKSRTSFSSFSGKRPSITGMMHCIPVSQLKVHNFIVHKQTYRMSSKSHAASFFIAETLLENFWIVSRPNVGTCQYLHHCQMLGKCESRIDCLLAVKLCNSFCTLSVEDLDKVHKHCLPNTQLKLMHEVNSKREKKPSPNLERLEMNALCNTISDMLI